MGDAEKKENRQNVNELCTLNRLWSPRICSLSPSTLKAPTECYHKFSSIWQCSKTDDIYSAIACYCLCEFNDHFAFHWFLLLLLSCLLVLFVCFAWCTWLNNRAIAWISQTDSKRAKHIEPEIICARRTFLLTKYFRRLHKPSCVHRQRLPKNETYKLDLVRIVAVDFIALTNTQLTPLCRDDAHQNCLIFQ